MIRERFLTRLKLTADGAFVAPTGATNIELNLLARFHVADAADELLNRLNFAAIDGCNAVAGADSHLGGRATLVDVSNDNAGAAIGAKINS